MKLDFINPQDFFKNFVVFILGILIFLVLFEVFLLFTDAPAQQEQGIDSYLKNYKRCSFGVNQAESGGQILDNAAILFEEGKAAKAKGDIELALSKFQEAAKLASQVSELYEEKARTEFILGMSGEAVLDAQKAIELCEKNYRAHIIAGDVFYAAGLKVLSSVDSSQFEFVEGDYAINGELSEEVENALQNINAGTQHYNTANFIKNSSVLFPLCAFRDDTVTDYSLLPNFRTAVLLEKILYFVKTNSIGIRADEEFKEEKQQAITRVFFMGDSYSFGWGVDRSKSMPFLLEQKLNQSTGVKKFEVMNLSVPGFDPIKENLFFDKFSNFNPDVVIIGFNGTDIVKGNEAQQDCVSVTKNGCLYNKECKLSEEHGFLDEFLGWSHAYTFFNKKIKDVTEPNSAWSEQKSALTSLIEKIRLKNAVPVIVFIPLVEVLSDRDASDRKLALVKNLSNEKNVFLIDVSDSIIEKSHAQKLYYEVFDDHTNAYGNEVIAEEIAR
ncbi:MAG: hypothetical protein HY392_03100, partial [Candidatus Diapherotrites archaeon]|nr:hypothetical protein [Candidatus Diapherotrites archaeon]